MLPDQDVFIEKIYNQCFKKLMLYALSVLNDPDRAQDVVQDTFHEAVIHVDTLMIHENPGGWLMITLKNKIRESERARRRYLRHFLSLDTDIPENNLRPSEMSVEISDSEDILLKKIEQALTPEEYRLLTRFVFENASHLQIAKEFEISVYASQKRLERIRKKLNQLFPER